MTEEQKLDNNQVNEGHRTDIAGNEKNPLQPKATPVSPPPQFAGFWMRFWAYLLDCVVLFSINGILVKPIFRGFDISLSKVGVITPYGVAAGIIFYLYFILLTKFFGQTLGKMVFGLKVIPLKADDLSWGTIVFREGIGRYISATFNILYMVIAFTPKKQGLHDFFADTSVVHEQKSTHEPAYS